MCSHPVNIPPFQPFADTIVLMRGILHQEFYTESYAAQLLGIPPSTLHYWLEGGTRNSTTYPPILRKRSTGSRNVTWAEFVEAGFLRGYRRDLGVSMQELREFTEILRDEFGVPYPLATKTPWVATGKLVIAAQEKAGLPEDLWLYAPVGKQGLLLPAAQSFLERVEFENNVVVRWKVMPGTDSPVVIDPAQRFGKPSVKGISTEVLWEHAIDGYTDDEIAADFHLTAADVTWAVAYETQARAA